MTDQLLGFLLIGAGVVALAAIVAGAARGKPRGALHPPPGVHVPPGSWLPMMWAVAGGLLGAGLAFKPEDQLLNWMFALPALGLIVISAVLSVRAAGREWRETEHGSHDEGAAHH
ncbi:MAG TPA: hypothetical protein VIC63_04780 [Candidatus Limnocylindria bacterium]|jgi:hypothetical protein